MKLDALEKKLTCLESAAHFGQIKSIDDNGHVVWINDVGLDFIRKLQRLEGHWVKVLGLRTFLKISSERLGSGAGRRCRTVAYRICSKKSARGSSMKFETLRSRMKALEAKARPVQGPDLFERIDRYEQILSGLT